MFRATHVRARQHIDVCAEEWIGLAFPPIERAIDESQWSPDAPTAYCHRCGDSIGPGEATESGCSTCRDGAELSGGIGDGVVRLGTYTDELREWVRAIKYHRWMEMGDELGRRLGVCVTESGSIDPNRAVVVPMPMPWQRRMYRGIDHSRVIANGVARELHAPIVNILAKSMQPPQVTMIPSIRKRSGSRGLRVRRQWGISKNWSLHDLHVVLVDDVRTTGATLKAASRLLKAIKPLKVVCAVIAVSDSKARRDRATQAASL